MASFDLFAQSYTSATWLTTAWIISLGVTIGAVVIILLAIWGFVGSKVGVGKLFDSLVGLESSTGKTWSVIGIFALISAGIVFLLANMTGIFERLPTLLREANAQVVGSQVPEIWSIGEIFLFLTPLVTILLLGLFALTSRRVNESMFQVLREGPMFWTSVLSAMMITFCIIGFVLAAAQGFGAVLFVQDTDAMLKSLKDYPTLAFPTEVTHAIPVEDGDGVEVKIDEIGSTIVAMTMITNEPLGIAAEAITPELEPFKILELDRDENDDAGDGLIRKRYINTGGLLSRDNPALFFKNRGEESAELKILIETSPPIPQIKAVYYTAGSLILFFLLFVIQRAAMPKVSAIALSTFKTEISQPMFVLLMSMGAVLLFTFVWVPYNTFGEDIKILKDSGLTVILVISIFMAVFAASKSVAEEIEGRTALTVLSKPIGRRAFILGKFFGISWSVALMFVTLGLFFIFCVSYKPIYDAVEASAEAVEWQTCYDETTRIIPGLILGYMEVLLFVAISIVISTRMSMRPNLLICATIYVLGHLTPLLVQSSVVTQAFEIVVFVGQLIAVVLPVLDHFNIQGAVSGDTNVPMQYLGWSFIYTFIYGTIALLLGLVFFEDRDLA